MTEEVAESQPIILQIIGGRMRIQVQYVLSEPMLLILMLYCLPNKKDYRYRQVTCYFEPGKCQNTKYQGTK